MNQPSLNQGVLVLALAFGAVCLQPGCGSGGTSGESAPVSQEVQQQAKDMLKDYGKKMADQAKAQRAASKRP